MINTLDFLCAFRVLQSVRMKCSTFSEENPYRQLLSPFYRRSASALLKNDSVKSYQLCTLKLHETIFCQYLLYTCFHGKSISKAPQMIGYIVCLHHMICTEIWVEIRMCCFCKQFGVHVDYIIFMLFVFLFCEYRPNEIGLCIFIV